MNPRPNPDCRDACPGPQRSQPQPARHSRARDLRPDHAGRDRGRAARAGVQPRSRVDCFQSNHEGALIDRLQRRDFDWAIVNAGGLTHTSVSLRDALKGIDRPFVEVHLSDPDTREPFRQVNFLRDIAAVSIVGKGAAGYSIALDEIAGRVSRARRRPPARSSGEPG